MLHFILYDCVFFRFIFDICIHILFDVFLPANFFFTGGHQVMRRALCKLPKRRTWKLWVSPSCHPDAYDHPEHTVDAPAKSESPVENGGKHPILYRVSTCFNHPKLLVQDFATTHRRTWFLRAHWEIPREIPWEIHQKSIQKSHLPSGYD